MYRKWRHKIVWRKVLVKCNFKVYMKRNRGLLEIHKQLVRSSMTYGGMTMRDSIIDRAKGLLKTALEQSERIKYLKIAVRKFKKCISTYQQNFRIRITFREIMLNVMISYWNRVIEETRILSKENECEHVYQICKELENVQWFAPVLEASRRDGHKCDFEFCEKVAHHIGCLLTHVLIWKQAMGRPSPI